MRLKDRVAIVTGGGFGIGRAYSQGLAREGAKVVMADINDEGMAITEEAIGAEGGEVMAVHTDVSDQKSTEAMTRAAVERFGRIDILVNNAAWVATLPLRDFEEIEVDEWDKVMAINLRGPFLCCKAAVPYMKEQMYGKIINISSSSIMTGNPKRIHYVTSKAGLVGYTRSLAHALGEYNICVNTLMPGSTASEGIVAAYPEGQLERAAVRRAFKRVELPEDLVGGLIFLSSSDSDFMTGQSLVINGGDKML